MKSAKALIKKAAQFLGYEIISARPLGRNPISDMKLFVGRSDPLVFDVGANIGQTIRAIRQGFPESTIHSFEPSPNTFADLAKRTSGMPKLHIWNCGLGSTQGELRLLENSLSDMSSFLPLSSRGWGEVVKETPVEVITIDNFCDQHGIGFVDILKSDTQGFEHDVFQGADKCMRDARIGLVYFEIIFSDMYKNIPPFDAIHSLLESRGFKLVTFYDMHYQHNLLGWTDALYAHESYLRRLDSSLPG